MKKTSKQIRENYIEIVIKNDKGSTLNDGILNNLHKDIKDIINKKWNHYFRKLQGWITNLKI